MNVVKEIQRINQRELGTSEGWSDTASWHAQYKDTAWIFVANLDYELTEGDVVCIFSQYGEPVNIEMARDQKTGKSMGFAFLQYENQKSTILAVDNLNGTKVLSRTLRVDHSYGPKKKKRAEDEEEEEENYLKPKYNVAPPTIEEEYDDSVKVQKETTIAVDEEDPMAAYFREKHQKESKKHKKKKSKKEDRKLDSADHDQEDDRHRRHHHKSSSSSSRKRRHEDDKLDDRDDRQYKR